MFCNKCGNQLPDGAVFCGACGNRIVAPEAPKAPVAPAEPDLDATVIAPAVQEPQAAPVYEAPVQQAPVYQAPAQQPPVYEAPAQQAPVYQAPAAPQFAAPPVYQPPVEAPKKKKTGLIIGIVVAVLAVVAIAVAAILLLGNKPSETLELPDAADFERIQTEVEISEAMKAEILYDFSEPEKPVIYFTGGFVEAMSIDGMVIEMDGFDKADRMYECHNGKWYDATEIVTNSYGSAEEISKGYSSYIMLLGFGADEISGADVEDFKYEETVELDGFGEAYKYVNGDVEIYTDPDSDIWVEIVADGKTLLHVSKLDTKTKNTVPEEYKEAEVADENMNIGGELPDFDYDSDVHTNVDHQDVPVTQAPVVQDPVTQAPVLTTPVITYPSKTATSKFQVQFTMSSGDVSVPSTTMVVDFSKAGVTTVYIKGGYMQVVGGDQYGATEMAIDLYSDNSADVYIKYGSTWVSQTSEDASGFVEMLCLLGFDPPMDQIGVLTYSHSETLPYGKVNVFKDLYGGELKIHEATNLWVYWGDGTTEIFNVSSITQGAGISIPDYKTNATPVS